MQDANGNYIALGFSPPDAPHFGRVGTVVFGADAPTGTPLPHQMFFVDTTNGEVYVNQGGTWQLIQTGDVSGVTGNYKWDGTGSKPSATGVAVLIGTHGSGADGLLWTKTTVGTNNTDWVAL